MLFLTHVYQIHCAQLRLTLHAHTYAGKLPKARSQDAPASCNGRSYHYKVSSSPTTSNRSLAGGKEEVHVTTKKKPGTDISCVITSSRVFQNHGSSVTYLCFFFLESCIRSVQNWLAVCVSLISSAGWASTDWRRPHKELSVQKSKHPTPTFYSFIFVRL